MTPLGQRLRELREGVDISLRELAKKAGVSAAFLSDIELGRRYPSAQSLARIAETLGADLESLQALDNRPAVEELRRMATENPRYGFAFRTIVDSGFTPEELLDLVSRGTNKNDPK